MRMSSSSAFVVGELAAIFRPTMESRAEVMHVVLALGRPHGLFLPLLLGLVTSRVEEAPLLPRPFPAQDGEA